LTDIETRITRLSTVSTYGGVFTTLLKELCLLEMFREIIQGNKFALHDAMRSSMCFAV
jgi:hypothetical protein